MWKMTQVPSLVSKEGFSNRIEGTERPDMAIYVDGAENAKWLLGVLEEASGTVVKLYCRNKKCQDFGGYITRTKADTNRTVYLCDQCGKPMSGGEDPKLAKNVVGGPEGIVLNASEKHSPASQKHDSQQFVNPQAQPIHPHDARINQIEAEVKSLGNKMDELIKALMSIPEQKPTGDNTESEIRDPFADEIKF